MWTCVKLERYECNFFDVVSPGATSIQDADPMVAIWWWRCELRRNYYIFVGLDKFVQDWCRVKLGLPDSFKTINRCIGMCTRVQDSIYRHLVVRYV